MDYFAGFIAAHPCRAKHKACKSSANRLAAIERDATRFQVTDCILALIRAHNLDIVTFASELGISTVKILKRVVTLAATCLPRSLAECVLPTVTGSHAGVLDRTTTKTMQTGITVSPQLPKRLFRRIGRFAYPASPPGTAWLSKLLSSLADVPSRSKVESARPAKRKREDVDDEATGELNRTGGPVTSLDDLEMILVLLLQYSADASSHQGYPLAMAVHHRAYALARLLLLFGANPSCKEGLAAQIAIRNGFLDILHLFVTGPCLDADVVHSLPIPAALPLLFEPKTVTLDQTHLRLAIQCRQWELVDYIWHEQLVSPDMACLRLIDKLR